MTETWQTDMQPACTYSMELPRAFKSMSQYWRAENKNQCPMWFQESSQSLWGNYYFKTNFYLQFIKLSSLWKYAIRKKRGSKSNSLISCLFTLKYFLIISLEQPLFLKISWTYKSCCRCLQLKWLFQQYTQSHLMMAIVYFTAREIKLA